MWPFISGKYSGYDPNTAAAIQRNEDEQEFVSCLIDRMQGGTVKVSDAEMARFRQIQRRIGNK